VVFVSASRPDPARPEGRRERAVPACPCVSSFVWILQIIRLDADGVQCIAVQFYVFLCLGLGLKSQGSSRGIPGGIYFLRLRADGKFLKLQTPTNDFVQCMEVCFC
jgi:hypothetical protein